MAESTEVEKQNMKYELSEFVKMVAKHEGMVLEPYKDSLGISTIGIGRNLEDRGITDTELNYIGKTLEDILEIKSYRRRSLLSLHERHSYCRKRIT